MVQARRKFVLLAAASATAIGILVVVLIVVLVFFVGGEENECDLPIENQTLATYCRCHNSTEGYMKHYNESDKSLEWRYEAIKQKLRSKNVMSDSADLTFGSCDEENQALQSMAMMGRGLEMDGFEKWKKEMDLDFVRQMFAVQSLYFAMNGDGWTRRRKWLIHPNICSWEGVQ